MKIKDLKKISDAEKIILAQELWDSVSKKGIELTDDVQKELDHRLQQVAEGKAEYYTWNEVKNHLKKAR